MCASWLVPEGFILAVPLITYLIRPSLEQEGIMLSMRMVSLSLYCSRHCNLTYNSNDTSNGGSCKNVFILCHLSLGPIKLIRDLLYNERLDDGVGITSPYVWQKFL